MAELTVERLKEVLGYDALTGAFVWKVRMSLRVKAGDFAGSINKVSGYRQMKIDGESHQAHRLAWAIHYGGFPDSDVDHINGVRADNRIENLRAVSRGINCQNQRTAHKRNKLGVMGVHESRNGKFIAQITIDGTTKGIGTFDSIEVASEAYLTTKRNLHKGNTI